jgi:2-C-methyl-D-erythritol 4-phosphate cytidylyltransferase
MLGPMGQAEVRAAVIVLAAGAGRRLGGPDPKAFVTIGGLPLLAVAAATAAASPAVVRLVVTAPSGLEDRAADCLARLDKPFEVVTGGNTRQASVRAALGALSDDIDIVAVHDAARPFAPPDLFSEVIAAVAGGVAGALPAIPVNDTVKRVHEGVVVSTLDRRELVLAQTPQAFRLDLLRQVHVNAITTGVHATDDATLIEMAGHTVRVLPGDPQNFKITTLMDLATAEARMGGPLD